MPLLTEELAHAMNAADAQMTRMMAIAHDLQRDKGIPFMTAIVMAGDTQSAESATERVKQGESAEQQLCCIGSYARFDWAVANLPHDRLLELLPELWRDADPNDTNPAYLKLWQEAYKANGEQIILDGEPLIATLPFNIYRGQVGNAVGISWTLDRKIAQKFAATGGGRSPVEGGKVLKRKIKHSQILAYLTKRGEKEVVVNDGPELVNIHDILETQ